MGLHLKFKKENNLIGYIYIKITIYSADNFNVQYIGKREYKKSKAKELKSKILLNLLSCTDRNKRMLAINIINNLN